MKVKHYFATSALCAGLLIANSASAQNWLLGGNSPTDTDTLGNITNQSLRIITNNVSRVFIKKTGQVGIGINNPTEKLHVNGNIKSSGTLYDAVGSSLDWNTAYGWGNHALAGYLLSETDPQVGANALNYVPKWDGASLITSNIYSSGTFTGINATAPLGAAQFVIGSTSTGYYGMYVNSTGAAGARKPFYGYGVGGASNCWTYYEEASKTFRIYNVGDRVAVDSLGQVGIGTNFPGYYLDIQAAAGYRALNAVSNYVGSIGQIVNIQRTSAPSSANDIVQITVPSGSPDDFQFIEADVAGSNRFQVNGDGSVGIGFSTLSTARLNVDGSNPANKKVYGIYATADSNSASSYAIFGEHASTTSDARGVYGKCTGGAGVGYGVYGEAGYIGVRGLATATTYTGTAYGCYGSASGSTAGTRIGVYGTASGGSSAETNWGGYFPTKVYTTEIRVGTTGGATGYIACIGGKLIAEEVRVELEASWPDYVFKSDYSLMSLKEVEQHIKEFSHLPGVPSADEVECNGLHLGEMQNITMKKVEELTLYLIQMQKQNEELQKRIEYLEKR